MTSDQRLVRNDVTITVRTLAVPSACLLQGVLYEEGNDASQAGGLLLTVGETGHRAIGNKQRSIVFLDGVQHTGSVTYQSQRPPHGVAIQDDLLRGGIVHQIPQRTVATRVEHRVERGDIDLRQRGGGRQGTFGLLVNIETASGIGLHLRQRTRRVDRRLPTPRRG